MSGPLLRTERLLLVPLADRHLDHEVALDSDAEVLRYLYGRARSRAEVVASHAERMALGGLVDGLGYWVAFRSPDDAGPPLDEGAAGFVGLMMLPPVPGARRTAELGYRLVRRWWRHGYASEASRALLRHAFGAAGRERVIARTMAVNRASRAVMEAVGMRHVRTFTEHWDDPLPGTDEGEVEYEMTRAAWAAAEHLVPGER